MTEKSIKAKFAAVLADIENPKKDAENPHFRSSYASLGAVLGTVKPCLQDHGLTLRQRVDFSDGSWSLFTSVIDADGEELEVDRRPFAFAGTPQQNGSEETYLRRYALMCGFGLSAEDDDGNDAEGRTIKAAGITFVEEKTRNELMPALRKVYKTWRERLCITNEEAMQMCVECIGKPITDDLTAAEVNTLLEMMRSN